MSLAPGNRPRAGEATKRRRGLLCRLGCHEAETDGAFHGATFHSQCRGCGTPMVRRGACWSMAVKADLGRPAPARD